jgi:hypothetical protein
MPGYPAGRSPRSKGMEYPADPPRPEEIVLVMRQAGHDRHRLRVRVLIAVRRHGRLRISEALALNETDIDLAASPSRPRGPISGSRKWENSRRHPMRQHDGGEIIRGTP